MELSTYTAARYVLPLREGGSLPAVVEMEEGGLFAVKFRGAGQGARALVAELIVGRLAGVLGLPVPEIALVHLEPEFGRTEPDPEIQDVLRGSRGWNVGLRFLDGSFAYDPVAADHLVDADTAAAIVWLDALASNVDRTPRNSNILVHERRIWLIDHGAALYFHHNWDTVDDERARAPFTPIRDHVLLPIAGDLDAADARLAPMLSTDVVAGILAAVPDELLMDAPAGRQPAFASAEANRRAYADYFRARLEDPRRFVADAERAQTEMRHAMGRPVGYRR